jgi:hypothetical protein
MEDIFQSWWNLNYSLLMLALGILITELSLRDKTSFDNHAEKTISSDFELRVSHLDIVNKSKF